MDKDHIFKIMTAGAGGVGKTTLLYKYINNTFVEDTSMTIGVQLHVKEVDVNGITGIKLQLWDLGGQQHFRFILPQYMRGAAGALLMFDLTSMRTTMEVEKDWLPILRGKDPNLPVILVGTKKDLVKDGMPMIDPEWAPEFVKNHDLLDYIEISSKTGENVEATFNKLVSAILDG